MHMLARSTSLSQRSKTSKKLWRICQKICTRAAMSASLNFVCPFVLYFMLHVPCGMRVMWCSKVKLAEVNFASAIPRSDFWAGSQCIKSRGRPGRPDLPLGNNDVDKRPLLEDLANNAFQTGGAQKARKRLMSIEELRTFRYISDCLAQVAGVFDRYISFVSLSPTLFSLNLPAAPRPATWGSCPVRDVTQWNLWRLRLIWLFTVHSLKKGSCGSDLAEQKGKTYAVVPHTLVWL